MAAEGSASLAGVPVQRLSVRFEDFKQPVLELDYRAQAPLPEMIRFIEQTPLLENTDLDLDQFRFENMAETSGHLVAPLRAGLGEFSIDGRINLQDNRFTELKSAIELEGLTGEISYDREGMTGSFLAARYKGHAAALSLRAAPRTSTAVTVTSAANSGFLQSSRKDTVSRTARYSGM